MKKGWILYYKEDLKKNKRFVELLTAGLRKYEIETEVIVLDSIDTEKSVRAIKKADGNADTNELFLRKLPDFVVNRSRNYKIAEIFCEKGVKVFNSPFVSRIANDKRKTYHFLKGIVDYMPLLDLDTQQYPFVIKSCSGHGGNEVFLVNNEIEKNRAISKLKGRDFICQSFCDRPGRDLRVYIIGNKIVTAMLRCSSEGFKSNYSLGGEAKEYILSKEEEKAVQKILEKIPIDYGGIDFIFNDGRIMFNEIEDAVGARMVYENTSIDIINMYAYYIASMSGKLF